MTPSDPSAVYMGVIFILAGLGCAAFVRRRVRLTEASRGWPTAAGKVIASEVKSYRSGEDFSSRRYYPAVVYEYEVGGRRLRGKRLYFDEVASYESWARGIVAKYPPGSTVPVYYDPAKPTRALLEPERSGSYNYGLFGCAFIVIGLFFIVYLGFLKG